MFDLRYHVASLAAVFIALVIGIVVGVGISGRGLLQDSERRVLNDEIARLRTELERESMRSSEQDAAQAFVGSTYEAVMHDRLRDRRIAVVFVGSLDPAMEQAIEETVRDAGGELPLLRMRALSMPVDPESALSTVSRIPDPDDELDEPEDAAELGEALGQEFVLGGETPLWEALDRQLVEQRRGRDDLPADAVVVVRTAEPQGGESARFVFGLLRGLEGRVPVVGIERGDAETSAREVFRRAGLSTVTGIDGPIGRVALAVLLAGGEPGQYGVAEDDDALLPPVDPVEPVVESD